MADLAGTIAEDLAAYYAMVGKRVHKWAGGLSTEQLWRKPYPYGNSVGHLILHLTGNLNYYIGAQIGETGYVRNRDREFTEPKPIPKEEVFAAFDKTIAMVVTTIRKQ